MCACSSDEAMEPVLCRVTAVCGRGGLRPEAACAPNDARAPPAPYGLRSEHVVDVEIVEIDDTLEAIDMLSSSRHESVSLPQWRPESGGQWRGDCARLDAQLSWLPTTVERPETTEAASRLRAVSLSSDESSCAPGLSWCDPSHEARGRASLEARRGCAPPLGDAAGAGRGVDSPSSSNAGWLMNPGSGGNARRDGLGLAPRSGEQIPFPSLRSTEDRPLRSLTTSLRVLAEDGRDMPAAAGVVHAVSTNARLRRLPSSCVCHAQLVLPAVRPQQ